jgi:hypothetical protein
LINFSDVGPRRGLTHSSLVSEAGSDEGGKPVNGAALRLDFKVTVGLRVITLLPSIDFNRGHCVY